jgi:DNA-binding CsgD family transcriptional regulator
VLGNLGLDPDAEAIYRLLLQHSNWGVAEIAQSLRCSEAQVRDALDRLADLMLLRRSRDAPGSLRPVNPELALRSLIEHKQAELLDKQQRLVETQAAASLLIADYTETRRTGVVDGVEWLAGLDAVQARLEQLACRARSECQSLMPGGGQSAQSLAASKPLDELMLQRGVSVLTVYVASVRNDPATLSYARWLTGIAGAVRTIPALTLRMVLFDRGAALVPIDPKNSRQGAIQITIPGVITALDTLFQAIWETAVPLGDESKQDNGQLTGQERELVRLMAKGLTDEAAARMLGVSLRTERRMMAQIMRRLGARSRFEAGFRASQREWSN